MMSFVPLTATGSEQTGSIEGKVTDRDHGWPIEGATIRAKGMKLGTTSDENGYFWIRDVPSGTYWLEIRASGYEIQSRRDIQVSAGKTTVVEFTLEKEFIYTLDEIVVTATRMKEPMSDIDGSVSVIHREVIEILPTTRLVDIIDMLPGFQTYSADGNRMSPGVNIRGFTGGGLAEYVLVMVNGIPMNDLETGLVNWNLVPVEQMKRIEVLRGPSSVLYGDIALGGVINIMTDEAKERSGIKVSLEGGSYGEYSGNVDLTRVSGSTVYTFFASEQRRDGWREHSNWQGETVNGAVKFPIDQNWNCSLSTGNQRIQNQMPGPLPRNQLRQDRRHSLFPFDNEDQRRHQVFLTLDRNGGNQWETLTNLYFNYKDTDIVRTLFQETKEQLKKTSVFGLRTQYSRRISWSGFDHHLVAGAECEGGNMKSTYYDLDTDGQRFGSPSAKGTGTRKKVACFLQDKIIPAEQVSMTFGIRWDGMYDDYEDELVNRSSLTSDKSAVSTKVGLNWKPEGAGHLYANIGRAFKAPTLEQLFDQRPFYNPYEDQSLYISNAALEAQAGTNYEIGLKRRLGPSLEASLSLYQMDMEDEIDFDLESLTYMNIGQSRHRGFEGEARFKPFSTLTSFISYTYSDAQFKSGENSGHQINNIPYHLISVGLLYSSAAGFTAGAIIHSVKDQYLDGANTFPLADYTTATVRLSCTRGLLTLTLDGDNIFDTAYCSFGYVSFDPLTGRDIEMLYPAEGRTIKASVTLTL
jgi:iron complex outermembrane receptor protein